MKISGLMIAVSTMSLLAIASCAPKDAAEAAPPASSPVVAERPSAPEIQAAPAAASTEVAEVQPEAAPEKAPAVTTSDDMSLFEDLPGFHTGDDPPDLRTSIAKFDGMTLQNSETLTAELKAFFTRFTMDQVEAENPDKTTGMKALLGYVYDHGAFGRSTDIAKAKSYYEPACEPSNVGYACFGLAEIWANGDGVEQNDARATTYYGKACRANYADACFEVGERLLAGIGRDVDVKTAYEGYTKACSLYDPRGCVVLAKANEAGLNGDVDVNSAVSYYEKACKMNDGDSCFVIGEMFKTGDRVEAHELRSQYYFGLGCDAKHAPSCAAAGRTE